MNLEAIERVLRDYDALRLPDTDPELEAVSTAILIEDVFGIVLSDGEIDAAVLGDRPALAAFIAGRVEAT